MSVTTHQEKLEKVNLDGLTNWMPRNAAVAKELVLPFITSLHWKEISWGVQVQLGMRFASMIVSPSKNDSDAYRHCFWRRCALHSGICWSWVRYAPSSTCGVMQWSWCRRKTDHCDSAWTSTSSMHGPRRTHTPCHKFRKCWKVWQAQLTFHDGFHEQLLASKDSAGVPEIHGFYSGKLGVLQVYWYTLRALQCSP